MDSQSTQPKKEDDGLLHPIDAAAKKRADLGTGFGGGLDFYDVGIREPLTKFTKYGVPLSPMLDLHEERAQNQSRLEKWGRGIGKMLTTGGGAFVDGTAGIAAGIIQSIGQGDRSKFYDNVVGREVDSMNEYMQEHFPHYSTQKELNTKGLASMGYANFWSDKVLNGVGYMAGMIASTATGMGAIGAAGKAMKASSIGLKTHRITKAAVTGADAAAAMEGSARAASIMDAGKTALVGFASAFAEASVEARELLRRKESELLHEAAKAAGVSIHELSPAQKEKANEEAKAIANTAFALNSLVVGVGNVVVFGNLLRPKYLNARKGYGKSIKYNEKTKLWEDTLSKMSKGKRLYTNFSKPMARGAVVEAFQESTQYAIQEGGAEAMHTSNSIAEAMDAWGDAYSETFSSKEGIDSTLVGAIVGILGGGSGAVRRHYTKRGKKVTKEQTKRRADIIAFMNDPNLVGALNRAEKTQDSIDLAARMQHAYEQGDHKTYRDIQAQLIAKEALQFADADRLDLLYEKLDEALALDDITFREIYGIPESVSEIDKNKLINGIKTRVKQFVDLKNNFDAKYQAPTRPGKNASKEELAEWSAQTVEFDMLRNEVLKASFGIEDIDARISKLVTEINNLTGSTFSEQDALLQNKKELEKRLNEILRETAEKNPQRLDEVRDKITDFSRLALDREAAVRTINELQFDSEMRDFALMRKKNQQDQDAKEQRSTTAVEKANNATTEKELNNILENEEEGGELTNEAKIAVGRKQAEVAETGRKLETDSQTMSVAELENLESETQNAIEKDILSKIIAKRKEAGQLDPPETPTLTKEDMDEEEGAEGETVFGDKSEVEPTEDLTVVTEEEVWKSETQQRKKGPTEVEHTRRQSYKDGVRTTRFGFRKKGSDNTTSSPAPVQTALGGRYKVDEENIPDPGEGFIVEVTGIFEIRESESGAGATVQFTKTNTETGEIISKFKGDVKLIETSKPSRGQNTTPTEEDKQEHQRNRVPLGGIQVQNGELNHTLADTGEYVVELVDGEIKEGTDSNQKKPDGTPLPINRQFVKETSEEELLGMPLKFRILETYWSAVEVPKDIDIIVDPYNVPVGIYAQSAEGEILIGMLPAAETTVRLSIGSGQITEGKIAEIHAGNVITTVDESGKPVFFPLTEAINDADITIGVVREDGTIRVSKQLEEDNIEKAIQVEDMNAGLQEDKSKPRGPKQPSKQAKAGRVVLIGPRPGEGVGIKLANTARLDDLSVQAIFSLLQENSESVALDIREIVGLTIDESPATESLYMQKEPFNNIVIYFTHASGDLIQIRGEEMSKALKNEFFKFKIGAFQPVTETISLESGEEQENIILDAFGKPKYKFNSIFSALSELQEGEEGMSENELEAIKTISRQKYDALKGEFIESFKMKLLNKRRQVNLNDAYNNKSYVSKVTGVLYDSYLDYLSSPDELKAAQGDIASIVAVDGKAHKGSFYYDIQVKIANLGSDSQVGDEVVSPTPKVSVGNTSPISDTDISELRSDAGKVKRRRKNSNTIAEKKGEQTKKDCK